MSKKIIKEIARQIKAWREEQHYTQEAFAEHIGTKQTCIARAEGGKHALSVTTLLRIAKGFGAELSIRLISHEKAPTNSDLVEALAATIHDAHPSCSVHARWSDLVAWIKIGPNEKHTKWDIEHYRKRMKYRREEARAVLHFLGHS
jgi:transcriptional regulator with XRE-family HTH domain